MFTCAGLYVEFGTAFTKVTQQTAHVSKHPKNSFIQSNSDIQSQVITSRRKFKQVYDNTINSTQDLPPLSTGRNAIVNAVVNTVNVPQVCLTKEQHTRARAQMIC